MNQATYAEITKTFDELGKSIEDAKRPGYTQGNVDVLHNFKTVSALCGIRPLQAWGVYTMKHMQSVLAYAMDPNIRQAEPLGERFADLRNYVRLGHALWYEESGVGEAAIGLAYEAASEAVIQQRKGWPGKSRSLEAEAAQRSSNPLYDPTTTKDF